MTEPAFPQQTDLKLSYTGMSLRDYFAAKALQGLLSNRHAEAAIDEFAAKSYRMADAMMKQRSEK
jgi:hypothetical protein